MNKLRKLNKVRQQAHLARNAENRAKAKADEYRLERDKLKTQNRALRSALTEMVEWVEEPPEASCSCHISPPCRDCEENSSARMAFEDAREALQMTEEPAQQEPAQVSRAEWRNQAEAHYIDFGLGEKEAKELAQWLCGQQDWLGDEVEDPLDAVHEDVRNWPRPTVQQEPVAWYLLHEGRELISTVKPRPELVHLWVPLYASPQPDHAEALAAALEMSIKELDHEVPSYCYSTGPLSGDPIEDFVTCPGCRALNAARKALAAYRANYANQIVPDTAQSGIQPNDSDSKDAARYRWLRDNNVGPSQIDRVCDDCNSKKGHM